VANPILGQDPDEKLKKQYPNLFWKPPRYRAGVTGPDIQLAWQREFDIRKSAMFNDQAAQRRYQQQVKTPDSSLGLTPEQRGKGGWLQSRVTPKRWQEHVEKELESKGWSRDKAPADFDPSGYTILDGRAYTAEEMQKAGYQLSDGYWTVPDPYAAEREETIKTIKDGEKKTLSRATILGSRSGLRSTKLTGPRGVEGSAPVAPRVLLGAPPGDEEIKKKRKK